MKKMRMESVDMTEQNIEKIASLFPNCITETLDKVNSTSDCKVYKKVINFNMLRQILSSEILEGDEAYEFTWVGKKAAIVETNRPIRKTLRPCPKESVDWDTFRDSGFADSPTKINVGEIFKMLAPDTRVKVL